MSIFASKLSAAVFIISLLGLFISGVRVSLAVFTQRVRALIQVYSKREDPVEYHVWFVTYICLLVTFLLIVFLFLFRTLGTTEHTGSNSSTGFYTAIILVIQFSALIAFVPFLVRMLSTGGKSQGGNSKSMKIQLQQTTQSLQAAMDLLEEDYHLESQENQNGITCTTFSKHTNSSALIRIESKGDEILEIY